MIKRSLTFFILLLFLTSTVTSGPVYLAGAPIGISKGGTATLWAVETPTPGNGTTAASVQVAMPIYPGQAGSPFSIDGKFSGAPGVFEIDVQVAAVDADTNYQTISGGNITSFQFANGSATGSTVLKRGSFCTVQ